MKPPIERTILSWNFLLISSTINIAFYAQSRICSKIVLNEEEHIYTTYINGTKFCLNSCANFYIINKKLELVDIQTF